MIRVINFQLTSKCFLNSNRHKKCNFQIQYASRNLLTFLHDSWIFFKSEYEMKHRFQTSLLALKGWSWRGKWSFNNSLSYVKTTSKWFASLHYRLPRVWAGWAVKISLNSFEELLQLLNTTWCITQIESRVIACKQFLQYKSICNCINYGSPAFTATTPIKANWISSIETISVRQLLMIDKRDVTQSCKITQVRDLQWKFLPSCVEDLHYILNIIEWRTTNVHD